LTAPAAVGSTEPIAAPPTFEDLLAEGAAVPVVGWDFSWFAGRATEERPPWGYASMLARRMAAASAALDLQTGGGEVLATIPAPPPLLVATEAWSPNLVRARDNLRPLGASVVEAGDADLPFAPSCFDLVVSRHPVTVSWPEIARVLRPGGAYLAQHVGAGSLRELTDFMMGAQPVKETRSAERAVAAAAAAGLDVVDLRQVGLRTVFDDVGAVVHFLRKVIWIVPGFTVEGYRARLAALHEHIEAHGPFVAHAQRFLIEARRPEVPVPPPPLALDCRPPIH
jgi:SAM-dependent methyltransferase